MDGPGGASHDALDVTSSQKGPLLSEYTGNITLLVMFSMSMDIKKLGRTPRKKLPGM